ncbi:MAG: NYN domain-containing protein [Clostridia bacterium]|jgi:uncharacterized LabA/DUF88 family protein|nr:NYN domain-containing protein [Clostridia bacterium]
MDDFKKIALLIDADNTSYKMLGNIIQEVAKHGHIVIKRAYGNWKKDNTKNWEDALREHAVKPIYQIDYTEHKNATDIALVIDAMDIISKNEGFDAFVIVSSDSDYTPLAIYMQEANLYVMGIGNKQTPQAFRRACDDFVFLENIGKSDETDLLEHTDVSPAGKIEKTVAVESLQESGTDVNVDAEDSEDSEGSGINVILDLLDIAHDTYQEDNGFTNVSAAGAYIKRVIPDFDAKNYGYFKLPKIIEAYSDRYEIKRYKGKGTVTIVAYRCK